MATTWTLARVSPNGQYGISGDEYVKKIAQSDSIIVLEFSKNESGTEREYQIIADVDGCTASTNSFKLPSCAPADDSYTLKFGHPRCESGVGDFDPNLGKVSMTTSRLNSAPNVQLNSDVTINVDFKVYLGTSSNKICPDARACVGSQKSEYPHFCVFNISRNTKVDDINQLFTFEGKDVHISGINSDCTNAICGEFCVNEITKVTIDGVYRPSGSVVSLGGVNFKLNYQ